MLRAGPDAAELYKTPLSHKLRRKLSPYVSFEERDTDLFHMIGIFYNDDTQWRARGVLTCGGAFTSLIRLVSRRAGRGWFLFRI